uniref:Uncharacterized protein n=1 Tax=Aegilops tauschii subsp. strangulata TaxID=200361 RepID=A0A452Y609_AEGTS
CFNLFPLQFFPVAKSGVSKKKEMYGVFCAGWFAQGAVVFKIYHVLKCLNQRLMLCTERILRNFRRLKLKASLKTE